MRKSRSAQRDVKELCCALKSSLAGASIQHPKYSMKMFPARYRLGEEGEGFKVAMTTLDGVERKRESEDLVVTDGNQAVALAGDEAQEKKKAPKKAVKKGILQRNKKRRIKGLKLKGAF